MESHQKDATILQESTSEITPLEPQPAAKTAPVTTNSSPILSPISSPSHEFSFTISLHSTTTTTPSSPTHSSRPRHHQTPSAIDLSPADDIFFHGHLLPLHFLSHLHAASPRSSTTSRDSFTLPVLEAKPKLKPANNSFPQDRPNRPTFDSNKPKSFSLSGFSKWIKGSEPKEKSRRSKFDVAQFVKRYIKMVKPLLSSKGERVRYRENHQSYSFSGSLSPRIDKRELRGLRGEFSAPASMRTSPTNSGLLLAKAGIPSPVSDSTMEELQSAIQAAIAHCKNSTSTSSVQDKSQELSSSSPVPVN